MLEYSNEIFKALAQLSNFSSALGANPYQNLLFLKKNIKEPITQNWADRRIENFTATWQLNRKWQN